MQNLIKKILKRSPLWVKKTSVRCREAYYRFISQKKEMNNYPQLPIRNNINKPVKNILLYHLSGLSFGGSEKSLQMIANELVGEYNVFFLHSSKGVKYDRKAFMNTRITLIDFDYSTIEKTYPYFIHDMNPHIKDVITKHSIDVLITVGSGHTEYPFNTITTIPIILINVFGSPTLQKNIMATLFISQEVKNHAQVYTGKRASDYVSYIPIPTPILIPTEESFRQKLHIPSDHFVFGRIGRNANNIFDPIGIKAFKEVQAEFPQAHYLIMSPPPVLEKIVQDEKIPNVHFLPPSGDEKDIWNFHQSLDALAHFRLDGETQGLNICESMCVGNPIITHTSHIWNAHKEYLDDSFARIASKDDTTTYASYMKEFILTKRDHPLLWEKMRQASKQVALTNFSEATYKKTIKDILHTLN